MTLIIIFAVLAVLGIPFVIWEYCAWDWSVWRGVVGWSLIVTFGLALVLAILGYIPSKKDSEIKFARLQQERISIMQMLESDRDADRIALNKLVIDYNNRVISNKEYSKRFILKDYYSKDVNWDALELIEWK